MLLHNCNCKCKPVFKYHSHIYMFLCLYVILLIPFILKSPLNVSQLTILHYICKFLINVLCMDNYKQLKHFDKQYD